MRKIQLCNDQFYHVYNRGVLKTNIFSDNSDYVRFLHYLYEFNNASPVHNLHRRIKNNVRGAASNMLVDVICYCCMPNHFHLVLKQKADNGIHKFMHKISTGYAMYFNKKYDRTGILFEGPFKAINISEDAYLLQLSRYIHLNPLSLIEPKWTENGIEDWSKANNFLETYRWSSYTDYIGNHNFPSILNKNMLNSHFTTPSDYKQFTQEWMITDVNKLEKISIE